MRRASTEGEPIMLDHEQVTGMRAADGHVFRWTQDDQSHVLELIKEIDPGDGFGTERRRVQIPARAVVHSHGQGFINSEADRPLPRAVHCHWVLQSLPVRPEWQTFARLVWAGEMIEQERVIDNRTGSASGKTPAVTLHFR
jgi:hypothetical protein